MGHLMSRPATFDHLECRALYATGEWTQAALAEKYGVTPSRIGQVCDLERNARVNAASHAWATEHYNKPCAGGCGARVWKRGNEPSHTGLCPKCLGETRRTSLHGSESRYKLGCRCDDCRRGVADARRRRRINSRVPCSHGCGTLVDSNPSKPPECVPCANRRTTAILKAEGRLGRRREAA